MGFEAYTNAREAELRNGERQRAELDQMQAQRTRRQAGNALQTGDYAGASDALFQGGDVEGGLSIQNAARTRQTADREQTRTALLAAVTGLRHVPEPQRPAMLQQIGPRLAVYGITPEQLGAVTPQDLSDRGLDALIQTMGGDVQGPRIIQGSRGALDRLDPYSNEITSIRAPQREDAPNGYRWADDGVLEPIPGGPADPAVAGRLATSRRAPPRPRAPGRGGGSAPRPAAAPARKPWENF